jgi:hypothetical protein
MIFAMRLLTIFCAVLTSVNAAAIMRSAPATNIQQREAPEVIFNPHLKYVRTSPITNLLRRVTFKPAARDEYCGEFTPIPTTDAAKPLVADCQAIADAAGNMEPGRYTITSADFAVSEWVTVARAGTCVYAVKLKAESVGQDAWIGTNDVRFQIDTTVRRSKDGRAGFGGSVDCFNGRGGILANWKLAYAS